MKRTVHVANDIIKLQGNGKIRILGRHTEPDGMLAFDWTNSGFVFSFKGSGFQLYLGKFEAEDPAYIRIYIDGKPLHRVAVATGKEKLIVEGLSNRKHTAAVIKVSESDEKVLFESLQLFGIGAELLDPPKAPERRMEFIGDSLTCGYGILGRIVDPDFQTYQEDGSVTFAAMTAENFGAEARFHSNSGKGIVCNCLGDYDAVKAGQYCSYQTRLGGECEDGWTPDVVVLNIGSNDCCLPAPKELFADAARALIAKLRARYPNAHIIWIFCMAGNYYHDTLTEVIGDMRRTDGKVHYLPVETFYGVDRETGANGHCNMYASLRVSKILTEKVAELTGWDIK